MICDDTKLHTHTINVYESSWQTGIVSSLKISFPRVKTNQMTHTLYMYSIARLRFFLRSVYDGLTTQQPAHCLLRCSDIRVLVIFCVLYMLYGLRSAISFFRSVQCKCMLNQLGNPMHNKNAWLECLRLSSRPALETAVEREKMRFCAPTLF